MNVLLTLVNHLHVNVNIANLHPIHHKKFLVHLNHITRVILVIAFKRHIQKPVVKVLRILVHLNVLNVELYILKRKLVLFLSTMHHQYMSYIQLRYQNQKILNMSIKMTLKSRSHKNVLVAVIHILEHNVIMSQKYLALGILILHFHQTIHIDHMCKHVLLNLIQCFQLNYLN